MKMRPRYALAAAAALAVPAVLIADWASKPLAQPDVTVSRPSSPPQRKIILIGESWAGRKEIGQGIIATAPVPVAVCQLGYSGYWAGKVLRGVERGDLAAAVKRCGFEGPIDAALILAGINDVLGHRGPKAYASKVTALIEEAHKFGIPNVFVMTVANIDWRRAEGSGLIRMLHVVRRYVFDRGVIDASPRYRATLEAMKPRAKFISYDGFAPAYRDEDFVDGIHLTDQRYYALGEYLGRSLPLDAAPREKTDAALR